jgi:hypothetical protein
MSQIHAVYCGLSNIARLFIDFDGRDKSQGEVVCSHKRMRARTHTHTHIYTYIHTQSKQNTTLTQ